MIVTGPSKALTATLDTTSFTWNESLQTMSRSRIAGNAVRRPGGPSGSDTFTTIGGYDTHHRPGAVLSRRRRRRRRSTPGATPATWHADAPRRTSVGRTRTPCCCPTARWWRSAAAAASSSARRTGGGGYVTYADGRARQVELYDPATRQLDARAGPAGGPRLSLDRGAAARRPGLLGRRRPPSARARTARTAVTDKAEIYSPPYLFKGARPAIGSAPQTVGLGDAFGIHSHERRTSTGRC